MKKLLLLFGVCALMFACSGNGPRHTAEAFLVEISKGNFDKASKYCTQETASLLTMAASFAGEEVKKEGFKFNFVREEIDGDKATVYYTDESGAEDSVDLKKVDGKWKVAISK